MNNECSKDVWSIKESIGILMALIFIEYLFFKNQLFIINLTSNSINFNIPKTSNLYFVLIIRFIDVTAIFFYIKTFKANTWDSLGFIKRDIIGSIKSGIYTSLIFGVVVGLCTLLFYLIYSKNLLELTLVPRGKTVLSSASFFFHYILVAGILAPIAEEIVFRGILFSSFKSILSQSINIPLNAFIFAFAHGIAGNSFSVQFIGGLTFAYLFNKTGSIVAPCIVHIAANIAIASVVFYFKNFT